ncbi:MAG: tetratricopeptide repeat protein, partial [Myxococcota bacterium]
EELSDFDRVGLLIRQNKYAEAIPLCRRLLSTSHPDNFYINYQLGNAYFELGQWTNGLKAYSSALRKNRAYAKKARLNNNAIRAFGNSKTWPRARNLYRSQIGKAGIPFLRKAGQRSNSNVTVRNRANTVLRQLR